MSFLPDMYCATGDVFWGAIIMADTTVTRSIGGTVGFAVAALAGAGGAFWLYTNDHAILAAIAGFFSFSLAMGAFFAHSADCPHCGSRMSAGAAVDRCGCGEYSRTENGRLVKVEPDYVADSPAFVTNVDQLIVRGGNSLWPEGCCVCGAPSVRHENLSATFDSPGVGMVQRLTLRFNVPHCQNHKRGVEVVGGSGWELKFRSHRYWREFCRVNGIPTRQAPHPT